MFEIRKKQVTKLLYYVFVRITGLRAATYIDVVKVRIQ